MSLCGSSPDVSLQYQDRTVRDLINFLKDVGQFLDVLEDDCIPRHLIDNKNSISHRIQFFVRNYKSKSSDSFAESLSSQPSRGVYSRPSELKINSDLDLSRPDVGTFGVFQPNSFVPHETSTPLKSPERQFDDGREQNRSIESSSDDEAYMRYGETKHIKKQDFSDDENYSTVDIPAQGQETRYDSRDSDNPSDTEEFYSEVVTNVLNKISEKPARYMEKYSDFKGWLWKKDTFFKKTRYWGIIYEGRLYLFNEPEDSKRKAAFSMKDFKPKRDKASIALIRSLGGKGKSEKHKFEMENENMAVKWMNALEDAIHFKHSKLESAEESEDDYDSVNDGLVQGYKDESLKSEYDIPVANIRRKQNRPANLNIYDNPQPKHSGFLSPDSPELEYQTPVSPARYNFSFNTPEPEDRKPDYPPKKTQSRNPSQTRSPVPCTPPPPAPPKTPVKASPGFTTPTKPNKGKAVSPPRPPSGSARTPTTPASPYAKSPNIAVAVAENQLSTASATSTSPPFGDDSFLRELRERRATLSVKRNLEDEFGQSAGGEIARGTSTQGQGNYTTKPLTPTKHKTFGRADERQSFTSIKNQENNTQSELFKMLAKQREKAEPNQSFLHANSPDDSAGCGTGTFHNPYTSPVAGTLNNSYTSTTSTLNNPYTSTSQEPVYSKVNKQRKQPPQGRESSEAEGERIKDPPLKSDLLDNKAYKPALPSKPAKSPVKPELPAFKPKISDARPFLGSKTCSELAARTSSLSRLGLRSARQEFTSRLVESGAVVHSTIHEYYGR